MAYLSRSLWSAIGLLAVGAGVGLYAYYGTYRQGLEEDRRRIEKTLLYRFDPGQVAGGEVSAKGSVTRFGRSTQGWVLTSPVEALADRYAIQVLIAEMAGLQSVTTIEPLTQAPEKSGSKYGLEDPLVKVVLELVGGEKVELRVGAKSEFDGRYFVQNPALSTIGLAEPAFLRSVELDVFKLRDKRVVLFDAHEVDTVEVGKGGKTQFRLERRGNGWDLMGTPKTLADPVEVVRLVERLRDLRAKAFVDDSGNTDPPFLARFGLDVPSFVVSLGLSADRQLVLRLGSARLDGTAMGWFAKADGSRAIIEIDPSFYKELDRSPLDFKNLRIIDVDPNSVGRLRIEAEGEAIELVRTDGDAGEASWKLTSPKAAPAASYKVAALIYALTSLKAKKVDTTNPGAPELRRAGLEPAKGTITLWGQDQKPLGGLLIGNPSPQHQTERLVMAQGGNLIEVVDLEKLGLPSGPDDLLELAASPDAN